jgi:hypothetical protein
MLPEAALLPLFVTCVTEPKRACLYPGTFADKADGTGETMSLEAITITGLISAVVLIVVAITLINKFAH